MVLEDQSTEVLYLYVQFLYVTQALFRESGRRMQHVVRLRLEVKQRLPSLMLNLTENIFGYNAERDCKNHGGQYRQPGINAPSVSVCGPLGDGAVLESYSFLRSVVALLETPALAPRFPICHLSQFTRELFG